MSSSGTTSPLQTTFALASVQPPERLQDARRAAAPSLRATRNSSRSPRAWIPGEVVHVLVTGENPKPVSAALRKRSHRQDVRSRRRQLDR